MDVDMPVLDGIAATACLRRVAPEVQVVVLSAHGAPEIAERASAAGAAAFVSKDRPVKEVVDAVVRAYEVGCPHDRRLRARDRLAWAVPLARPA
jgi:two-component system response regulator DesR